MKRSRWMVAAAILALGLADAPASPAPARAILVIIDGLHYQAPERLDMPAFNALARAGTRIDKMTGIIPYHPAHGDYARIHTSSYPNPMMMAGTIFLVADQVMLQHRFERSAFVANSRSYQSITNGYQFVVQQVAPDAFAVDQALDILARHDVTFLRLHLQDTGNGGSETLEAPADAAYRHDIWHPDSPYVRLAEEADRQLGRLVEALQEMQMWDNTLLVVTSDHGQTRSGWHPTLPEESWLFPAVLRGPGIREAHRMEWADQTDIAPTIAHLMQVEAPNRDGGAGRVLESALAGATSTDAGHSSIYRLNRALARYIVASATLIVKSRERPVLNSLAMGFESDFYGLERVLDWPELGSIEALAAHNEGVAGEMEAVLDESGD